MKNKYSKIYVVEQRNVRYNYTLNLLELIDVESNMVCYSMGLSLDNWNDDKMYWIECFISDINNVLRYLIKDLEEEFGL